MPTKEQIEMLATKYKGVVDVEVWGKQVHVVILDMNGDCSLVRRFCSPKLRKSEIKGSSFRRFCSPKVRKSDNDFYRFMF